MRRHVGRPRGGDPVETRRGILRAAEECFAASGFAGATTRRVAALAGVNVATLHYHFRSKEKLYRAVLDAIPGDVPFPEFPGTPEERLSSAVETLWEFGTAHPAFPRLSLLHGLVGPTTPAGALETPEDPRAAYLARTLTETGQKAPLAAAEAARAILVLLDSALVASQDARRRDESAPSMAGALRAGVVAAALRVAGLA